MRLPCTIAPAVLLLACTGGHNSKDDDSGAGLAETLHVGPEVQCEAPVVGLDRFTEEATARGVTEVMLDPVEVTGRTLGGRGGGVAIQDMDLDGDLDLVLLKLDDAPFIYANDGSGYFTLSEEQLDADLHQGQPINAIAATDLDGDGLPEILQVLAGMFQVFWNEGDLRFSGVEVPFDENEDDNPQGYLTLTLGDLDGDGDLDLALPSAGPRDGADPNLHLGGPDRLFLLEGREFTRIQDLVVEEDGSRTMVGIFTDRDEDGDLDLFIPADRGPPSAFWRNDGIDEDGRPVLVNEAGEIGADLDLSAMGIDSADLNGDGLLDHCITDIGLPRCLLSNAAGYAEGSASLGVSSEFLTGTFGTIGWSLDLADLDNDGRLEMMQASGPDDSAIGMEETDWPDLFWQGTEGGQFEEITGLLGEMADTRWNFGLSTADLNGDGYLDLVVAGSSHLPTLYMNQCGENAWVEVDLVGPSPNTEAVGARVEIMVEGRWRVREIQSLRSQGQTPSKLHFGLGAADQVDELHVYWPDGEETHLEDLPSKRVLTLHHPDAAWAPWL